MSPPMPNQEPAEVVADRQAREAAGLRCPLGDATLCRLLDSIEQVAGGRVLQTTCATCGSGCARRLDAHEEPQLRKGADYEPPPPAAEAATEAPPAADLATARPAKPPRSRKERDRLDLPPGEP